MIRFRTLGALDLRGADGHELRAVLAQPKRVALFAYLALATPRGPQRRDSLVAVFWPEHDAEHARNSLSQSVHVLRRSLGANAIVSRNGDALGVEWGDLWCDAVAFEDALDAGRTAEAVETYRGDLLEGFHLADSPDFERWLDAERARLAGRYAAALETLAEEREGQGDFSGSVVWWRRLAARDPFSSRVALRLMRALAGSGDSAAAVQHARVHEALLAAELDIPADPEIAAFVRRLQSGHSEAPKQSPSLVPVVLSVASSDAAVSTEDDPVTASPVAPGAYLDHSKGHQRLRRRVVMTVGGLAAVVMFGHAVELGEPSTSSVRSLAVLPFDGLSSDSTADRLAEVLHDALIGELARYPELRVRGRTSVLRYKGTAKQLPEIAAELKVDALIEATVLEYGDSVRVTARLMHGPLDRPLWQKVYDRKSRDVFALQSELSAAIARELRLAIAPARSARPPIESIDREVDVRRLYLEGRRLEVSRSPVGLDSARRQYELALERNPTFAPAYAGLSAVHSMMAEYDYAPARPAIDTARMMAEHAFRLDSAHPAARTAMAVMLATARDFDAAERHFLAAIRSSPSDGYAHYWYSVLLVALGRGKEARLEADRAMELDPDGPRGITNMQRYALWLETGERPHRRVPVAQRRMPVLRVVPNEPIAIAGDAYDLADQGECSQALAEIARARKLLPADNHRMLGFVGAVYWLCGNRAGAHSVVNRMKRAADARDYGHRIAMLHAEYGEPDSAFAWIEQTAWTLGQFSGLSADRRVDPLRADRRYAQLLVRLGLRQP